VEFDVRIENGCVIVMTSGEADAATWRDFHAAILATEGYTARMPIVIDHSDLDMSHFSVDDVRVIGDIVAEFEQDEGSSPIAVVAPRAPGYGLARMAQAYVDPEFRRTRVFTDRTDAELWARA
jgi:hypothetical protein